MKRCSIVFVLCLLTSCMLIQHRAVFSDYDSALMESIKDLHISGPVSVQFVGTRADYIFRYPGGFYKCFTPNESDTLWAVYVKSASGMRKQFKVDSVCIWINYDTPPQIPICRPKVDIDSFNERFQFRGIIQVMEEYGLFSFYTQNDTITIRKLFMNGDYRDMVIPAYQELCGNFQKEEEMVNQTQ